MAKRTLLLLLVVEEHEKPVIETTAEPIEETSVRAKPLAKCVAPAADVIPLRKAAAR